ncbi:hypothetical protein [Mucilaginibacter ginsenosidivorax]|uniref:Uncharacterized protein n=1 Tax=Mucilaginibacter ginsenosidivorax TaxID=862126 RepID=A0A5B8WB12_9SPHI|nr:hypothetical protein [Mucilaginibacter ginsenosidivorax]QEC79328.1 hypothetical protein FSB76_26515 [Mucilaginibacter ginsenosidivorax]
MIRIDPFLHEEMLRRFEQRVWDDEITPEQKASVNNNVRRVWEIIKVGNKGTNFFDRLFKDDYTGTARNHFIRKIAAYPSGNIPIKEEFLETILNYIGITLPEGTRLRESYIDEKKARLLYRVFEEQLMNESEMLSNAILNTPPTNVVAEPNRKLSLSENQDDNVISVIPNIDNEKFDNQKIKTKLVHLITQYFTALSSKNYNKAFEYWSEESRSAEYHWSGDLLKYIREHYSIKMIELEDCSDSFSAENKTFCFKIQYKTVLNSFSSDELDDINHEWTSLRELSKSVKKMNTVLERANRNDLNLLVLPIQNFLGYEIVEKVQSMAFNNQEKVRAIFPNKKIICYSNYAKIFFTQISQNEYLISAWSVLAKWPIPTPYEFKE